jgi:hypothetical protein
VLTNRRRRKIVGLFAFGLAAVLAVSAYAFTATNTFSQSSYSAGFGTQSTPGYTVTFVTANGDGYTYNTDTTKVEALQFTLDKQASDVKVALTTGTPTAADWYDCGPSAGSAPYTVVCDPTTYLTSPTQVADKVPTAGVASSFDTFSVAAVANGVVTPHS